MKTIIEIPHGSGVWFTFDHSKTSNEFREKLIAAFQEEMPKVLADVMKRRRRRKCAKPNSAKR